MIPRVIGYQVLNEAYSRYLRSEESVNALSLFYDVIAETTGDEVLMETCLQRIHVKLRVWNGDFRPVREVLDRVENYATDEQYRELLWNALRSYKTSGGLLINRHKELRYLIKACPPDDILRHLMEEAIEEYFTFAAKDFDSNYEEVEDSTEFAIELVSEVADRWNDPVAYIRNMFRFLDTQAGFPLESELSDYITTALREYLEKAEQDQLLALYNEIKGKTLDESQEYFSDLLKRYEEATQQRTLE